METSAQIAHHGTRFTSTANQNGNQPKLPRADSCVHLRVACWLRLFRSELASSSPFALYRPSITVVEALPSPEGAPKRDPPQWSFSTAASTEGPDLQLKATPRLARELGPQGIGSSGATTRAPNVPLFLFRPLPYRLLLQCSLSLRVSLEVRAPPPSVRAFGGPTGPIDHTTTIPHLYSFSPLFFVPCCSTQSGSTPDHQLLLPSLSCCRLSQPSGEGLEAGDIDQTAVSLPRLATPTSGYRCCKQSFTTTRLWCIFCSGLQDRFITIVRSTCRLRSLPTGRRLYTFCSSLCSPTSF